MISLLAKILIPNHRQTALPAVRHAYGMLCGMIGIVLNIVLFGIKLFAGILSGSVAIIADAFNNLSDAGSSVIVLIGFRLARSKPDPDHPFGHGRMEYISGLVVSMLIFLMGFELLKSAAEKIFSPSAPIESSPAVIVILLVSVLIKLYMVMYNHIIGKRIESAAMRAIATDSLGDVVATSVVLIATLVAKYTGLQIDGYCGVLVSIFILLSGYAAAKETIGPLLGQPPQGSFVDEIKRIVMEPEEIIGIHDLVVHDYGPGRRMISIHAEVPHDCDLFAIHDVIDNLECKLRDELGCEAVIHMDPIETDDDITESTKQMVEQVVKGFDPVMSIHDFRMVKGPSHTNLIFDLVIPYCLEKNEGDIRREIIKKIKSTKTNTLYQVVMRIDRNSI